VATDAKAKGATATACFLLPVSTPVSYNWTIVRNKDKKHNTGVGGDTVWGSGWTKPCWFNGYKMSSAFQPVSWLPHCAGWLFLPCLESARTGDLSWLLFW